jgi:hypothetical protein
MSAIFEQETNRVCVLRVRGELKKSELDAAQAEFAQKLAPSAPFKLLILLEAFSGWERGAAWDDTEFFFNHRDDFERIAVVGPERWEAEVLAFTGAGLRDGEVKYFPESSQANARKWLTG